MLLGRLCALTLFGCVAGCAKPVSDAECGVLLDRYVTLLVASDRPDVSAPEVTKMQAEARKKAARDPAFAKCRSEVTRGELECALEAPSADRFEQCLL